MLAYLLVTNIFYFFGLSIPNQRPLATGKQNVQFVVHCAGVLCQHETATPKSRFQLVLLSFSLLMKTISEREGTYAFGLWSAEMTSRRDALGSSSVYVVFAMPITHVVLVIGFLCVFTPIHVKNC